MKTIKFSNCYFAWAKKAERIENKFNEEKYEESYYEINLGAGIVNKVTVYTEKELQRRQEELNTDRPFPKIFTKTYTITFADLEREDFFTPQFFLLLKKTRGKILIKSKIWKNHELKSNRF